MKLQSGSEYRLKNEQGEQGNESETGNHGVRSLVVTVYCRPGEKLPPKSNIPRAQ